MSARTLYKGYIIVHTTTMSRLPVFRVLKGSKGPGYRFQSEYKDACERWVDARIEQRAARVELEGKQTIRRAS
jgi:hypothetical protein